MEKYETIGDTNCFWQHIDFFIMRELAIEMYNIGKKYLMLIVSVSIKVVSL